MSGHKLYVPDQSALNTRWIQPWSDAFRAQRDVGLRVPINFHTVPAVTLSQACFSENQFEHNAFQKCFSNLLGVGFGKFTVDVYWDQLRRVWSLCPVELPRSNTGDEPVSVSNGPTISATTASTQARIPESTAVFPVNNLHKRQGSSQLILPSAQSLSTTPLVSSNLLPSPSTSSASEITEYPTTNGPPLLQIGRYNCTSLMTLDLLTGVLDNFLETTATTTGAAINMLIFDVHAAASIQDPDSPAPQLTQNQLPVSDQLLSDILKGNLSDVAYTPTMLRDQRANLNESWDYVEWPNRPLRNYYRASADASGNLVTADGWPTETFMEFQKLLRVVLSYGTIDPQMQFYNIGTDLDFMFQPGTLAVPIETSFDANGQILGGCLFDASQTSITSQTNSSWAESTAPALNVASSPDLFAPIHEITNLTSCGLTPLLKQSLAGSTADKNPLPYAAYVHSTLWTWAPGEPLNATSDENTSANRCVTITISPHAGRWRVANCLDKHRVACQDPSQPYEWAISSDSVPYPDADAACRSPYQFSVPHTALENEHLLAALNQHRRTIPEDVAIFVDLNAIDVADCWVVGTNGTCPYLARTDTNSTRIVVVPTVAAVIIFLLAALTFFVKCAANRREDKRGRRRRMAGGWDYEGVPS
ncbi:Maintenance of telomere capping protein 6 [Coniothyrium glycines]